MIVTAADFAGHVRWCQNPHVRGDWTRPEDLRLVEGVIAHGIERTAAQLRRTPAECRARWNALLPPDLRSIRFQEQLLRLLREPANGVADA